MQAASCPSYPPVDIAQASQPGSLYYHDATFWRCWGTDQQQQLSAQVNQLHAEVRQAQEAANSSHSRAALLGGGWGLTVVLAVLVVWGLLNGRRRYRFALSQLRQLIAGDLADDRQQVAKVQARIEHERDDQRHAVSRLWVNWPEATAIGDVLAAAEAVYAHVQRRYDPQEVLAVDQARISMEVRRRGVELQQDLAAEIPRAERELKLEIRKQIGQQKLALIGAANRISAAMVGAAAELRNNPALADILHAFTEMQTAIQAVNPEVEFDLEALNTSISRAITLHFMRAAKVPFDGH